MQSLATGKSWLEMLGLGGESDEAVEKIREKTVELLTAIRTGQGDVSKLALEIDKLGTTSDVSAKLAASILDWLAKAEKAGKVAGGQFVIVADAAVSSLPPLRMRRLPFPPDGVLILPMRSKASRRLKRASGLFKPNASA